MSLAAYECSRLTYYWFGVCWEFPVVGVSDGRFWRFLLA